MKNINWKSYFTGMLSLGTIAFIGGVWDFQVIKADVHKLQKKEKAQSKTLKTMGIIICTYAIQDGMKEAKEICKEVLNN